MALNPMQKKYVATETQALRELIGEINEISVLSIDPKVAKDISNELEWTITFLHQILYWDDAYEPDQKPKTSLSNLIKNFFGNHKER